MKKLLLLPMMICLLLAGCRPEDDVDMPKPQKPVNKLIQGKWLYAADSSYYYFAEVAQGLAFDGRFFRPPTRSEQEQESGEVFWRNVVTGSYALTESGGNTYVKLIDHKGVHSSYTITTVSDSEMLWKKESGTGPASMEFTKVEPNIDPQQPISKLIQGSWYEISFTMGGNSYNGDFPFTYSFSESGAFYIYSEVGPEGLIYHYSIAEQDGKAYIEYYDADPATAPDPPVTYKYEILHISDKKMTLKSVSTNGISIIELIRA